MERISTTSFWLILTAVANLGLTAVQGQARLESTFPSPSRSEQAVKPLAGTGGASLDSLQNCLPALAPEELRYEYASGLRALKTREWAKAVLHLEQVTQADANHREAQKRLTQALKSLERMDPAQRLASFYAEGVAAMARNDWRIAFIALRRTGALNPGYRDYDLLLQRASQVLRQRLLVAHLPAVSTLLVDSLHLEATEAINRADWLAAIVALEKIQVLKPGYSDVAALLACAYQGLQTADQQGSSMTRLPFRFDWSDARLAAVLLLLPMLGYLIISPSVRAKVHYARGHYAKAMRIYEKLVARNPKRVKHYDKLARACLHLGRRDPFALKIYQIVLQLNLLNRSLRKEINDVVAQHYLAEGRHDQDAIVVLEEALAHEMRKHENHSLALIKAAPNGVAIKSAF
ncbi:MAG: tetratricopeptide repeat protein [bacterium]